MKIGVLTSSRADYGIYLPLLKKLEADPSFDLELIAFGTHLSKFHGFTLNEIFKEKFTKTHTISTLITNDDECSISTSYGLTVIKFADFWHLNKFDIVFCLGDRFEMSAAVQAGIPYNIIFAHLHGGETTLGAIDNVYRHQISLASSIHFTASETFSKRLSEIVGNSTNIHTVGSLSLDDLMNFQLLNEEEFRKKYSILKDFVLVTFHPETVSSESNLKHSQEIKKGLSKICKEIEVVITMPNADTAGTIFRNVLLELKEENDKEIKLIENFGKKDYFSAMKYANFLIGNTSSGIIEAASFNKYVINVGDRQKGRVQSENVKNIPFCQHKLYEKYQEVSTLGNFNGENKYYGSDVVGKIIEKILIYERN